MKLVISLVTRNRPDRLLDTVSKTIKKWNSSNTKLIIQVDEDDAPTIAALNNPPWGDKRVVVNIKPREDTLADKINRAMSEPGDAYLIASDDDPVTTQGYDIAILEAAARLDDGIGFVHGHLANLSFSCIVAPTVRMVEKLGYIQPGGLFPYWFVDHWTHDIGHITARISWADVRTDQTNVGRTLEMREPGWWATFFDACYLARRLEAYRLIDDPDFQETPNRKEMLKRRCHEVEMRSRWINDTVRAQSSSLENAGGPKTDDARYNRVRAHAASMIPDLLRQMEPQEAVRFSMILDPPKLIPALTRMYG